MQYMLLCIIPSQKSVNFYNLSVIILTSVVYPLLLHAISVLYGLFWIAHPEEYRFAPPTL